MTRRLLPLALLVLASVSLAGCGTPDEMEADESPRSEQESVGEGEVPGFGAASLVGAVAAAAALGIARPRR